MTKRSMALASTYASNTFPTELPSIFIISKVASMPCSAKWLTGAVPDANCRRVVIGGGDDTYIRRRLKPWQRVGHRSCGRGGMIPGDHDIIECHRQFAGELLRTHQDRPARLEYQPLDDLLRLVIMRLDRDERQILQPRPYRKIRRNIGRGKALKPLLVAHAKACGRSIERHQQIMRVRYAPYGPGRGRIFQIGRNGYLRPD